MQQFIKISLLTIFLFTNILITSCNCGEDISTNKNNKKDLIEDKKKYSSKDNFDELGVKYKNILERLKTQLNPSIADNFELGKAFIEKGLNNSSKLSKNDALLLMSELQLEEKIKALKDLALLLKIGINSPNEYDLATEDMKNELNKHIRTIKVENVDSRPNTIPSDLNHFFTKNNFNRAYLAVSDTAELLETTKKMIEIKIKS